MKMIILVLGIMLVGLFGCNQQPKQFTEQEVATLVARSVNVLQNRVQYGSSVNFIGDVKTLCTEFGMSNTMLTNDEVSKIFGREFDSSEAIDCKIFGTDSLQVNIYAAVLTINNTTGAMIGVSFLNPLRYGTIVPKRYKDAVYEEFHRQGWYLESFERWIFGNDIRLESFDFMGGYGFIIHNCANL